MQTEHPNMSDGNGLWLSITELARLKNLGKAAVSERVARFEALGLISTRPGKGKSKLVNLAAFDRAAGENTDLAREANGSSGRAPQAPALPHQVGGDGDGGPIYTREQARNMAYRADLSQLELQERLGKLVRRDRIEEALRGCAEAIARPFDQLPHAADELANAYEKGGLHGLRQALKDLARTGRAAVADALEARIPEEPSTDEL